MGESDFLKIRLHMSRGWTKDDAEKIQLQTKLGGYGGSESEGDMVVKDDHGRRLQAGLNFGRPNWNAEFKTMSQIHAGDDVRTD